MIKGKEHKLGPYQILGLEKTASLADIKKAYYKLALLNHPDRSKDEHSKDLFQQISWAYEILSDSSKREIYDKTGRTDSSMSDKDMSECIRNLYERVSLDKLDDFKRIYIGSTEELEDILSAYVKGKGSMKKIIDSVFWGDISEQARYYSIINKCVTKGIVPSFSKFALIDLEKVEKKKKRMEKETAEAEELLKDIIQKNPEMKDLGVGIMAKRKRDNEELISRLEAKYGKK